MISQICGHQRITRGYVDPATGSTGQGCNVTVSGLDSTGIFEVYKPIIGVCLQQAYTDFLAYN